MTGIPLEPLCLVGYLTFLCNTPATFSWVLVRNIWGGTPRDVGAVLNWASRKRGGGFGRGNLEGEVCASNNSQGGSSKWDVGGVRNSRNGSGWKTVSIEQTVLRKAARRVGVG